MLLSPLLETMMEDEDAQREVEENVDNDKYGKDEGTWPGGEATYAVKEEEADR